MKHLTYLAAAAWLASAAPPAPKVSPAAVPPVGPDAVWTPPADFRAALHAACDAAGRDMSACFLRAMKTAGASPAAVAFARRVGGQGYLTRFRESGVVDVAYAEYPFRANENRVVLLVNGEPPTIDVDDASRISTKAFAGDAAFAALLRTAPKLAIFPGDRSSPRFPRVRAEAGSGRSYVLPYSLKDGCHACRTLGEAQIGFDFDARGRLVSVAIVRVQSRPL